jgi:hypothetical protein
VARRAGERPRRSRSSLTRLRRRDRARRAQFTSPVGTPSCSQLDCGSERTRAREPEALVRNAQLEDVGAPIRRVQECVEEAVIHASRRRARCSGQHRGVGEQRELRRWRSGYRGTVQACVPEDLQRLPASVQAPRGAARPGADRRNRPPREPPLGDQLPDEASLARRQPDRRHRRRPCCLGRGCPPPRHRVDRGSDAAWAASIGPRFVLASNRRSQRYPM